MLTRRQKAVLPYLLNGQSIESVARASGVPTPTLRRWLAEAEFVQVLDELLSEQIRDAAQQLGIGFSKIVPDAIKAVRKVLKDRNTNPDAKLRAASLVAEKILRILQFQQALREKDLNPDETD